jgi:DNA-directed RNA polymerase specialized sigma24 family protein
MAILELPSFERFVFVMSVLEHYSNQECSLLLGCTRRDVIAAQTRALQQIGNSIERDSLLGICSGEQLLPARKGGGFR